MIRKLVKVETGSKIHAYLALCPLQDKNGSDLWQIDIPSAVEYNENQKNVELAGIVGLVELVDNTRPAKKISRLKQLISAFGLFNFRLRANLKFYFGFNQCNQSN